MTPAEVRAAIAEARAQEWDPEARPWLPVVIVREREPMRRRVRVLPGVMGEVIETTALPFTMRLSGDGFDVRPGVRIVARVWCDDLERWLDRHDGEGRT